MTTARRPRPRPRNDGGGAHRCDSFHATQAALFSANERAEDVATRDLRFVMVDFLFGKVMSPDAARDMTPKLLPSNETRGDVVSNLVRGFSLPDSNPFVNGVYVRLWGD